MMFQMGIWELIDSSSGCEPIEWVPIEVWQAANLSLFDLVRTNVIDSFTVNTFLLTGYISGKGK